MICLLSMREERPKDGSCEKGRTLWNKGKLVGQKLPLKSREIWEVRFRLQLKHRIRDIPLFNLGIDSPRPR